MDKRYTIAIIVATATIVFNQIFIQYFLREKKYDAKTINLAGKQRMLSQKINLEFYKVQKENQTSDPLRSLFKGWKNTHQNLLNSTGETELSPITHPKALTLMANLSSRISFMEEQMNQILSKQVVDLAKINSNQDAFLVEMNEVVSLLEKSSSDNPITKN